VRGLRTDGRKTYERLQLLEKPRPMLAGVS
jgi:hypothetical protein